MELVYLWVEDYKNIHKQGFNFSPRFNCNYDETNNELTIEENKDYINIFPENINITAIVGKNGSGKSSLLKSFDYQHFMHKKSYYIYYMDGLFYSNYFVKEKNGKKIEKSYNDIMIHSEKIYIDKLFFIQKPDNKYHDFMYEENLYIKQYRDKNKIAPEIFHKNILNLIFQQKCIFDNFYSPKEIKIKYNLISKDLGFLELDLIKTFNQKYNNFIYNYKVYMKSLEIIRKYRSDNLKENYDNNLSQEQELFNFIEDENNIVEYKYNMNTIYNFNDKELFNFLKKISSAINKKMDIVKFYKKYLKNYTSNYNIFYYLLEIGFLNYELYDKNKSFSSLSTGEKSLFSDFCLLNKELQDKTFLNETTDNIKNFIILMDEPDLTLHPDWQKKYLNMVINFLNDFKEFKFNLIITTHSSFLISDLPKENIIFLDTYKEEDEEVKKGLQKVGNCKVLSKDEVLEKKQTFGANIHTLLSDSFFMRDGLMGEFAKSKINEIIEFHKEVEKHYRKNRNLEDLKNSYVNKLKEKFWEIQRIVGEDYLKQVIKNHLIEIEKILLGEDKAKEEEIKRLQEEIERLKGF